MVLEKIKNAEDIKKLKRSEYRLLAQEIREFLIDIWRVIWVLWS